MTRWAWCPDPDCRAVAEIVARWDVWSTSGPVVHVTVLCCAGHTFRLPLDWVHEMT